MKNQEVFSTKVSQLHSILERDLPLPIELMKLFREALKELGEELGDNNAEEVLDNCLTELDKLGDVQVRAMVVIYLLGLVPRGLQKLLCEQQLGLLEKLPEEKFGNGGDDNE